MNYNGWSRTGFPVKMDYDNPQIKGSITPELIINQQVHEHCSTIKSNQLIIEPEVHHLANYGASPCANHEQVIFWKCSP